MVDRPGGADDDRARQARGGGIHDDSSHPARVVAACVAASLTLQAQAPVTRIGPGSIPTAPRRARRGSGRAHDAREKIGADDERGAGDPAPGRARVRLVERGAARRRARGRATVFPQAIALAATFDATADAAGRRPSSPTRRAPSTTSLRQGSRGRYQGLTFFSPNINIFRDPRWGRGHETFGEDPC